MKLLFLTPENLRLLVENLKKDCDEFIAPKYEHLKDIVFGDTKRDGRELLDYEGNSVISPRAFLLPQTEALFKIRQAKKSQFIPAQDGKKRIFYGVRPCDIQALALMRKFFLDEVADNFYQEKLGHSVFISLACAKPCTAESFCQIMEAGPKAKEGFDLQLIPIGKGYLVEAGTKKGIQLIKKNKALFFPASNQDKKRASGFLKGFTGKGEKIDFRQLAKKMQEDRIGQEVWEDIGLRCVVCSGCITLCPTCSCFSIKDSLNGNGGMRLRYCDGCPYAGFTTMAGGNTPFAQHKEHIRRFFEHKLNIDVARYGRPSCVGCARCIQTCPGNISIRKFVEQQ